LDSREFKGKELGHRGNGEYPGIDEYRLADTSIFQTEPVINKETINIFLKIDHMLVHRLHISEDH
jgi:hypothetical protein